MAILYLDPTGNGTPFDGSWSGDYTDLDDGDRSTGGTPVTDYIYSSSPGDQATITFTVPGDGTPSNYRVWIWADAGKPEIELRLSGTGQGNKTTQDVSGAGSWYGYDYADTTDFASVTEIAVVVTCGSDEDDEVEAMYLEITYTPGGGGTQSIYAASASLLGPSSVIFPPGAGGIG